MLAYPTVQVKTFKQVDSFGPALFRSHSPVPVYLAFIPFMVFQRNACVKFSLLKRPSSTDTGLPEETSAVEGGGRHQPVMTPEQQLRMTVAQFVQCEGDIDQKKQGERARKRVENEKTTPKRFQAGRRRTAVQNIAKGISSMKPHYESKILKNFEKQWRTERDLSIKGKRLN
ncbi:hypothetical protein RUM44_013483 [Polyplax serrata]|uniref:Uncharacterized protein n=1 Tax=Polyplax serrata TaxID=468196 RepID=A0ABR1BJ10_POLSC